MNKKTKILLVALIATLVIMQQLMQTVVPFFSSEYDSADEAIDAAVSMSDEDNKEEVLILNTVLNVVFVEDTVIALEKDGKYFASQGHFYYDGNTGKVVYCLDPTVMVGDKVAYEGLEKINSHTLGKFDTKTQDKIITMGLAANDLYNKTKDENYLLVGQYLVWEAAGSKMLHYDDYLQEYIDEVRMNAVNFQTKIDNGEYGTDRATILLNTSGQDLIGLDNGPVIDKIPNTDKKAPSLAVSDFTFIANSGDSPLVDLSSLKLSDFKAYAYDKEDGNLTKEIKVDYSKVDPTKPGVYPVTFTVVDASGNEATEVAMLRLYTEDVTYNAKFMLHSLDITVDNLDEILADKSYGLYQDTAKVYGQNAQNGKSIDVYSKFGAITEYPENEVSPKLTVVAVKNSTSDKFSTTNDNLTNQNYIYAVENLADLDGRPGLYANNMQSKLGEELDLDKLNALAIEFEGANNISDQIKYDTSDVDINTVGVYPIVISVEGSNGESNELTRYVTIVGEDTVVGSKQEVMIDAKDIYTNEETLAALADQVAVNDFIIAQAKALGMSMINGEELVVTVFSTDVTNQTTHGVYTATLSTTNGSDTAKKSITIYVAKGSDVIDDENPYLTADKVIVDLGSTVDDAAYNASAFDKKDGDITTSISYPSVDTSKVGPVSVTLTVTDSDGNTTTTDVIVTVKDENTEISPDSDLGLYATPVTTDILTLASADQSAIDEMLLSESEAYGFDTNTGATLTVTIDNSTITPTTTPGEYEVTFTVTDGVKSVTNTITVTVLDAEMKVFAIDIITNEATLSQVTDLDNFIYTEGNVSSTTSVVTRALTTTYSYELGSLATTSPVGTYPVTVTADNTVVSDTTSINVFVLPQDTVIPTDQEDPYLYGENIKYNLGDSLNVDDFNAYAFDNQDGDITFKIVFPAVDTSIEGVSKVTLSVTDNDGNTTTKDVLVAVNGDNTEVSPEGDVYLTAFDVYTNQETISSESDLAAYIAAEAKASGYDLVTGEELTIETDLQSLTKDSPYGTYEVTFTVTNGEQTATNTIKVYVAKDGDEIPLEGPYIISGPVRKNVGDVLELSDYNAYAVDRKDGDITSTITYPDVSSIQDAESKFNKFGSYTFELSVVDSDGNPETSQSIITVLDDDTVISSDDKVALTAKDIFTNTQELESLLDIDDFILSNSLASAFLIETGAAVDSSNITVKSTDLTNDAVPGIYTATIEVSVDGTTVSKDIDIYVAKGSDVIDDDKPYITGNSFIVNKGDTVTKDLFEAIAFDKQDGDLTSSINFNLPVDTSSVGVIKHTISVTDMDGNESETVVVITVKDESLTISPDEKVGVMADDIYTNTYTLRNYGKTVEEFILEYANAQGFDLETGDSIAPTVSVTDLTLDAEYGTYTSTIKVMKDGSIAERPIKIYVAFNGDTIDDEFPYIRVNNVSKNVGESLTIEDFGGYAVDKQDGEITSKIKNPSIDSYIDSEGNALEFGVHLLEFEVTDTDGNKATETAVLTILSEDSKVDPTKNYVLNAEDIYTNVNAVNDNLANVPGFIITEANAQGYNMNTAASTGTEVTTTTLKAQPGVYTATIQTANPAGAVSKQIKIYVAAGDDVIDDDLPYITGVNVQVKKDSGDVPRASFKVVAFDKQDGSLTSAAVVPTVSTSERGVFKNTVSVTDSDGNIATKDLYVTVTDGTEVDFPDQEIMVFADDIYTTENTVASQTDINQFILDNSNPSAFDYGNNVYLTDKITIKSETLSTLNGPGVATVEYTITGHTDVVFTINVFVTNDDDVIDNDKPYIYAESKVVTLGDKVTIADFNAIAFDKQDGDLTSAITNDPLSAFVDTDGTTIVKGVHKITFNVKDKNTPSANTASISVYLTVTDETSTIANDIVLFADSPIEGTELQLARVVDETEIKQAILAFSGAEAFDMTNGSEVTVKVTDMGELEKGGAPGEYIVTVTATTTDGRSVSKEITVNILDVNIDLDAEAIYTNVTELTSETDLKQFILDASNAFAVNDIGETTQMVLDVKSTTLKLDSPAGVYAATITATNGVDTVEVVIDIYVANNGDSIPLDDPYITANNFVIKQGDTVTAGDFKAIAFDAQDGELTASIDYKLPFDSSKPGVFKHTISVADSDTNETTFDVYITVLGPDTVINPEAGAILNAQDIYTNVATLEANAGDLETFLNTQSKLFAQLTADGTVITDSVTITSNTIENKAGAYTITYSVTPPAGNGSAVTKTINVFVADGDSIPTNPYVFGQNIVVDINTEFDTDDLSPVAFSNTEGDITSKIVYTTTGVPVYDDNGVNKYNQIGVFPVKLKVSSEGKTVEHTAYITVKDEQTVISEPEGAMIRAEDFTVKDYVVSDATSIDQLIIDRSKAIAFDMFNGEEITVTVGDHEVTATAGEYEVTLSATANGVTVTKTITVTVTESKIVVSADDIYTNVADVSSTFNIKQFIIDKSNAQITEGVGNIARNDIVTDLRLSSGYGEYTATIVGKNSVQEGSTTIKIYVLKGDDVMPEENPYITAVGPTKKVGDIYADSDFKGFAADKKDGNLTSAIDYSGSSAFQTNNVYTEFGVFPTTLSVVDSDGNSASIKVNTTVTTDTTVIEDDLMADAYDIFTNASTLTSESDINAFLISESKAAGYRLSDGEKGTVTVKDTNVAATAGIYDVTYTVTFADNSTIDVVRKVFVAKDDEEVPTDGKPYVTAVDYEATVGEAVTNANFEIVAFDTEDGENVNVSVSPYSTEKVGIYSVVVTATDSDGNTNSVTVKLSVTTENSHIENGLLLDFVDISTNVNTIKGQSDLADFIKTESDAVGFDIEAEVDVTDTITITNMVLKSDTNVDFTTSSPAGLYTADITVTSQDGTRTLVRTVNIFVADAGDTLDDEKPYLTANDVTVNVGDTVTNSSFGAVAFDKQDLDNLTINYPAAYDTSYPHVEKITLSVTDSDSNTTTKDVVMVVKGPNTVIENGILIDAEDISTTELDLLQVEDLDQWLIDQSNVAAYLTEDGTVVTNISISTTLTTDSTAGTYDVTFTATGADGKTASITIEVTVTATDIALSAESIYTNEETTANLTTKALLDAFIIEQSNATASHVAARSAITIAVASTDATTTTPAGEYTVTLSASSVVGSTTKTIRMIVLPGDSTTNADGLFIDAINVNANVGDTVTASMFEAYGYDEQNDTNLSTFSYSPSTFDTSKQGIFDVTITGTTGDGRSISKVVKLIVKDSNMITSQPDEEVGVIAYDFTTNTNTLTSQTDINNFILEQSKASGLDLVNAVNIDPTVASTTVTADSPAGVYTATIEVTNGNETASITINIFVANGDDVITKGETYIYAEDARVTQVDGGTVGHSVFNATAMNTDHNPYDLTSTITPKSFDISTPGVFKVTLTAGADDYTASTQVVLTVVGEDTVIDEDKGLLLDAANVYTNENTISSVPDITAFIIRESAAAGFRLDTAAPLDISINNTSGVSNSSTRGVYQVTVIGTDADSGDTISKVIDVVILPDDEIMPDNESYIYAEDASGDRSIAYDNTLHNAFGYDKGTGQIDLSGLTIEENVDVTIGDKYPVTFSFVNRDGETISIDVIYEVLMLPIFFEGKINAMNLDTTFRVNTDNYTNVTDFSYRMEIKTGLEVDAGVLVREPIDVDHTVGTQLLKFAGNELGLEPGKDYNIGFYEVGLNSDGSDRNYLVSGFPYQAPNIDPGADGKVYSCGTGADYGTLNDPCSGDNVSYINDVYELESIGYEEEPQAGRVEWTRKSATESLVDLTLSKYGSTYRPFSGNYRLEQNIDGSATKNDTRPDALGGFGSDGFKPIGFRFQNGKAWSESGSATGTGFYSQFSGTFTGTLDGNGFAIDGLYANRYAESSGKYGGLFGQIGTSGKTASHWHLAEPNLYDLTFTNGQILAPSFDLVGGLVGQNYGKIMDIKQLSDVTGYAFVGGIVGQQGEATGYNNRTGYLSHSYVNANVMSTRRWDGDNNNYGAGGIVGINGRGSQVFYSVAEGSLLGSDNTGAIVGQNYVGDVWYNASTMSVEIHSNSAGGIVGYNVGSGYVIENVTTSDIIYSDTTGMGDYNGGVVGWNDGYTQRNIVSSYIYSQYRTGGAVGASGGVIRDNVVIGSKIVDKDGNGNLGRVTENGHSNNYYTPNTRVFYNKTTPYAGGDSSREVTVAELQTEQWWIDRGYGDGIWDFSRLEEGYAPQLFDGRGGVLENQPLIRLDAQVQ